MKKAIAIAVISVLVAAAAYAGGSVKAFSLTTFDGKKVEYRPGESPLVIIVGSHWCPPCKSEAPTLQKAFQAYKDKGVRFIGVFVGSDDEDIGNFAATYGLTFPLGRDNGIARELGTRGMPNSIFVAKDGRIVRKRMGEITYDELEKNIREIMEAK